MNKLFCTDKSFSIDAPRKAVASAAELSEIIGQLYDGARETLPWSTILQRLRTHLNASWTSLELRPASRRQPALIIAAGPHGVERSTIEESAEFDVYSLNLFTRLPPEQAFTPEEYLGKDTWLRSLYFNKYVKPYDIRYVLGADFRSDEQFECRLRACRAPAAGPFAIDDKAFMQLLLPHFKRSVAMHAEAYIAETERQLYANTFDQLHIGTVTLDETGALLNTNTVAGAILAQKDGLWLCGNTLRASNPYEQKLAQIIKLALRDTASGTLAAAQALSIKRATRDTNLSIVVKNIILPPHGDASQRPAVAVFMRDPERQVTPSQDMLRKLFNFTRAEAMLARLLANGLDLDEASLQLHISKNTVRSRLQAIFSKTGVNRQSALTRILLDTIAAL